MISLTSPVRTRAHDWPAGAKLAGLCAATFILFVAESLAFHLAAFAAVAALYALPGKRFLHGGMARLWVLWPFVLILAVWHIATGSASEGAVIVLRMVTAVALANLVTMTTRLTDMIAVVRTLLAPLRAFGLPTRAIEIAMALVVRMTPVLLDKGRSLTEAWSARASRRPSWRIVLPFAVLALDDADRIAEALKARGGLTRLEEN